MVSENSQFQADSSKIIAVTIRVASLKEGE